MFTTIKQFTQFLKFIKFKDQDQMHHFYNFFIFIIQIFAMSVSAIEEFPQPPRRFQLKEFLTDDKHYDLYIIYNMMNSNTRRFQYVFSK